MFSPYYFKARAKGAADPEQHVSINVCLYGKGVRRWTMTERSARTLDRKRDHYALGPSRLIWGPDGLDILIDERGTPVPRPVRGHVRLKPIARPGLAFALDPEARHVWRPIAPMAEVEAHFDAPGMHWKGHGYFDSNAGSRPLEADFRSWHWSRGGLPDRARVLYDVVRRDGTQGSLALDLMADGATLPFAPPEPVALRRSAWGLARGTRSESGAARIVESFEDTPFYARARVRDSFRGEAYDAVHESLSLDRFKHWIVQGMLPFRMPRLP